MVHDKSKKVQDSLVIAQLGVIKVCRAITKSSSQSNENRNHYVDFAISNKPTCVLVDTVETYNFATRSTTKRLKVKIALNNYPFKHVNVEP